MLQKQVMLFYRKPRENGNFSIEISFDQMIDHFPHTGLFQLKKIVSSYYSSGIIARIKAILEARQQFGQINHITGDVYYLAFGLPSQQTILTIHDCGFMAHPSKLMRFLLKWFWLKLPVKRCKLITAVSEVTKKDIIHYTGCSTEKIKVIPTIISNRFKRSSFQFNETYPRILHIGITPNKNLTRHIQAIAYLKCQFHIIGKLTADQLDLLKKYNIDFINAYNLEQAAVQKAYEECDLLLFASTLEGFGMPILEAQTVGRPVITSQCSSMPEVAGKGAYFVNPYEIANIRKGIEQIIEDQQLRNDLITKGFENILRFQPEQVALQYKALYASIEV